MGAAAAAPVSSASKFAAAVQNRVSLDINKIKYMPHALKQNQSVRVLIQFDAPTVLTLAKQDRAAGIKVTADTKQVDRLAVRAAQRRPTTGKLKRSLLILRHVRSAFKQQARDKRVRGRVLQQRGLPPSQDRLPVPLLPVQALALMKHTFRCILRKIGRAHV